LEALIFRHLAYPRQRHVDDVFENIGEDTAMKEGGQPYEEKEYGSDFGAASEKSK
jgi:hypothetical protein